MAATLKVPDCRQIVDHPATLGAVRKWAASDVDVENW
jgi:hypothetical protein